MTFHSPRLLIVDQSLRDMAGHHYEYDLALLRAAGEAGLRTIVGAHISAQPLELLRDSLRPWFQKTWYQSYDLAAVPAEPTATQPPKTLAALVGLAIRRLVGRSPVTAVTPVATSNFGDEVLALISLEGLGSKDHVLVHTFGIPELDSLIELARQKRELPHIHLVLRRDAEEPLVATGPNGGICGSFLRLVSSPVAAATLRFYADTEELARQYAGLVPGIDVNVLPIPHCLPLDATEIRATGEPLRIVYLGDARREKGFHLLPPLVDAVAKRLFADRRARFVIQANVGAAGDSPDLVDARKRLAWRPKSQVEMIFDQLDISAFHDVIRGAAIVLLPYDAGAYSRRSSGILAQALAAGRAIVVPAGTWMARQAEPSASFVYDSEEGLARAVIAAVEQWPMLAPGTRERAARWHAQHNGARYIARLLRANERKID